MIITNLTNYMNEVHCLRKKVGSLPEEEKLGICSPASWNMHVDMRCLDSQRSVSTHKACQLKLFGLDGAEEAERSFECLESPQDLCCKAP